MALIGKIIGRVHRRWVQFQQDSLRRRFASCGSNVSVDLPTVIYGADHLRVGDNVSINAFVHIWAQGGLTIGSDTLIASHVTITTLTHDADSPKFRDSLISKPVVIGANVWIGSHAVIMPGVTIGDGTVVGAGAVVTKDLPARCVAIGIPARLVRQLS